MPYHDVLTTVFNVPLVSHFLTEHAPYGAFHVLKAVRLFLRRDTVFRMSDGGFSRFPQS